MICHSCTRAQSSIVEDNCLRTRPFEIHPDDRVSLRKVSPPSKFVQGKSPWSIGQIEIVDVSESGERADPSNIDFRDTVGSEARPIEGSIGGSKHLEAQGGLLCLPPPFQLQGRTIPVQRISRNSWSLSSVESCLGLDLASRAHHKDAGIFEREGFPAKSCRITDKYLPLVGDAVKIPLGK